MPIEAEIPTPIPPRPPRTYRINNNIARRDERAIRKPTDMSFEALLKKGIVRLTEEFYIAVDYSSRTYYYLQAAQEYERVIRNDPTIRAYVIQLQQKNSKLARSATRQASYRTLEIEVIASQAGLLYEEVPNLAFNLEGTVRQVERCRLAMSEFFLRYTMQHPWARLLVGWWPEKLALGCVWIFGACVFNAGTGSCWPAIDWTVRLSLAGPICALVHMVFLALKR